MRAARGDHERERADRNAVILRHDGGRRGFQLCAGDGAGSNDCLRSNRPLDFHSVSSYCKHYSVDVDLMSQETYSALYSFHKRALMMRGQKKVQARYSGRHQSGLTMLPLFLKCLPNIQL